MKFTTLRETLIKEITHSGFFTSYRLGDIDSLKGVYIKANKDGIEIKSTNITDAYCGGFGAKVEREGEVLVDYKRFSEIVKTLDDTKITVEKADVGLVIATKSGDVTLPLLDANTFPNLENPEKGIVIEKSFFTDESIKNVLFTAGTDETRPILTGVCFDIRKDAVRVVATDGFRLSVITRVVTGLPEGLIDKKIVIPSRSLSTILGEFRELIQEVRISPDLRSVEWIGKDVHIVTRFLDGEFPPYEKVIPQSSETHIVVKVADLTQPLKTIGLFAREGSSMALFSIEGDLLVVSSVQTAQGQAKFTIPLVKKEGIDNKITFNYRYVLNFLSLFPGREISFEMIESNTPGIFRIEDQEEYVHVIMPIRSQE